MMSKSEQIESIKRLIENIETYLQYADGPAYYNDLERLRELRAELKELEGEEPTCKNYLKVQREKCMSDLAQRLRGSTKWYHSDCELKLECAARIEKLEEQNKEMLEALEFLVTAAGGEGPPVPERELLQDCVDKAREAIAKAKGEE